jgi:ribosomal protein S3AE
VAKVIFVSAVDVPSIEAVVDLPTDDGVVVRAVALAVDVSVAGLEVVDVPSLDAMMDVPTKDGVIVRAAVFSVTGLEVEDV